MSKDSRYVRNTEGGCNIPSSDAQTARATFQAVFSTDEALTNTFIDYVIS